MAFVVINSCFIITINIVASTSKVTFTTSQPVGSMAEFLSFEAVGTFKIAISLITFRFEDSRHWISLTAILTESTDRTTSEIIKPTEFPAYQASFHPYSFDLMQLAKID